MCRSSTRTGWRTCSRAVSLNKVAAGMNPAASATLDDSCAPELCQPKAVDSDLRQHLGGVLAQLRGASISHSRDNPARGNLRVRGDLIDVQHRLAACV